MSAQPTRASLAPIYVALVILVAAGLLGMAVAFWPQEHRSTTTPAAYDVGRGATAREDRSSYAPPPDKRRRSVWM